MLSTQQPINTFSRHYRQKYGEPVGKIPIDTGVRCPNRDLGGCIFCRPASFTPNYLSAQDDITRQVSLGKRSILKGRFTRYLAYFQQETCTVLETGRLICLAKAVLADHACLGLIISTRPDCIGDDLLAGLADLLGDTGKECLIEIGMQSAHEESLALLNRNHGFHQVRQAIDRIKQAGPFATGVHLLFGIPGEGETEMLDSVRAAVELGVSAVKLHHLQVIKETPLAEMYRQGKVTPLSFDSYMSLLVKIIALLPPHIVIHRLWTSSHLQMLIAPKWHVHAGELRIELDRLLREAGVIQGVHSS